MADWFAQNAPKQPGNDWFTKNAPGSDPGKLPGYDPNFKATPSPVPNGLSNTMRTASGKEISIPGMGPISNETPAPIIPVARAAQIASRPGVDSKMEAASQLLEGAGKAVAPLAIPEMAVAPAGAAVGAGVGYLGSKLAGAGVKALGGGEGAQHLAGDLGGAAVAPLTTPIGRGLMRTGDSVVESAQGIRNPDRAYGRTPGRAINTHTEGLHPETVTDSAQERMGQLVPEYEGMTKRASSPVNLNPTIRLIRSEQGKVGERNANDAANTLDPLANHFIKPGPYFKGNTVPGKPGPPIETVSPIADEYGKPIVHTEPGKPGPSTISPSQPAFEALKLKRGINDDFINNWSPENTARNGVAKKAYSQLSKSIDEAVPEGKQLNQVTSSLIPVAKRGESTARNEELGPRLLNRVGARTGALMSAAAGAMEGGKMGGGPGALIGGIAGLAAPELAVMPTSKMAMGRGLFGAGRQAVTPNGIRASQLIPLMNSVNANEEEKKRRAEQ